VDARPGADSKKKEVEVESSTSNFLDVMKQVSTASFSQLFFPKVKKRGVGLLWKNFLHELASVSGFKLLMYEALSY
jgi:hypothetical protein